MSDLKLFRLHDGAVTQLDARFVALEKFLQTIMERNLDALLGVRFLASEYSTGHRHGGRIDTLGIDENGCPVIIEYKRSLNENVISQGLYYLDWLLDHKADFQLRVTEKLGAAAAQEIDWSSCRLLCIAGSFTKYDQHAVEQISRNIELIRYTRYGDDLLLLDLVNTTVESQTETPQADGSSRARRSSGGSAPVEQVLAGLDGDLRDLYEALKDFLVALGDDVRLKQTKLYVAFRRLKNFACVRPTGNHLVVWTKVDPDAEPLVAGFTRDVRQVGHYGTGDLEITIGSRDDLELAKKLLIRSYEAN